MSENIKNIRRRSKIGSSTWALVRRIVVTYLRPYFPRLLVAVAFMVLAGAMTAIFAKLVEPIIDDSLGKAAGNHDALVGLVLISLAVLGCFTVRGLAQYGQSVQMVHVAQGIVSDIQRALFNHFLTLDLIFFRDHPSGQLTARMVSDVAVMRTAVVDALTGIGGSLVTLVFLFGVMIYQDWLLSIAVLILLPFASFFIAQLGRRLRKISRELQQKTALLSDHLVQVFQGIRQVKAYSAERHEQVRAGRAIDHVKDLNIRSVMVATLMTPFNEIMVGLIIFGIIVYGGWRIAEGVLTAGELMSFIAAFSLAYEPMKKLAKLNTTLQVGLGAAERVFDMLDTPAGSTDRPHALPLQITAPPAVMFEGVTFAYHHGADNALNAMDFTAQGGRMTALVGRSGGGKSTVFNLLLRFYNPQEGRIRVADQDIADTTLASLRASIALVSQDITLFDDTVAANIAYGHAQADCDRIRAAAHAAHADSFIAALPDGYDTRLGEQGFRLSGGQRQRLAIARAIYKNAPILLLDEATSALDPESERLVQQSLDVLGQGRTTLVIAHRLTTVQRADHILVVDQGTIVETGTHDVLLARGGIYAQLYHQMLSNP